MKVDFEKVNQKYVEITKNLIEKNLTISTMESATAGLVATLLTNTEGASNVVRGGFVSYCNEAKISLGVPAEVIEKYSVYSNETASEMAKNACEKFGTEIGIGITGTLGNKDPFNPDNSYPGRVYFCIFTKDGKIFGNQTEKILKSEEKNQQKIESGTEKNSENFCIELDDLDTRFDYKLAVADKLADELAGILGICPTTN